MTVRLGQDWLAKTATEPATPPPPSDTEVALNRILVGLLDLKEAITAAPAPPAPIVHVDPTDLSDIVTAVNGLKPGASADDIATAIASKLAPTAQTDVAPVLEELVKRLETLDFRQLGMGRVGGGTVTLAPGQQVSIASGSAVTLPQSLDPNNTATRTAAQGAAQFVGGWTLTRSVGVVRVLTVLASTVTSGLGGTFVFEFSENGTTATISESRVISDFTTVRDFDLINAGAYFRVKFTPSRALTGAENIFVTTTLRTQNDGQFVRLADQEIEQANAALGSGFAFGKAFDPFTQKSVNLRPQVASLVPTPAIANLGSGGVYLTDVVDTLGFSSAKLLVATNVASALTGVRFEWSDTLAFTNVRTTNRFTYTDDDASTGFSTFDAVSTTRYLRIRFTNGTVAQGSFYVSLQFNSFPFLSDVTLSPSVSGNTGQQAVTLSASPIASPPLANRHSLRLRNLAGSAHPLYYGFSAGLTGANGDELSAGDAVDLDVDDSVGVYVIALSVGGAGVTASYTELA